MSIPRFNAQVRQIQIPSMQNYQAEQNESIANSLAKFGKAILGASMGLYFAKADGESEFFKLTKEVDKASTSDRR